MSDMPQLEVDLSGSIERLRACEMLPAIIEDARDAAVDPSKRVPKVEIPLEGSLSYWLVPVNP